MKISQAKKGSQLLAAGLLLFSGCKSEVPPPDEQKESKPVALQRQPVVVYSSVGVAQLGPALEAFTADTGIKVRLVTADYSKLAGKLENHGRDPAADLFVGDSLASLSNAAENDLLRPTFSEAADLEVDEPLSDPEKTWFPLGLRARPIIYNTNLVSDPELQSITDYESLREDTWEKRLCLSSSKVPGNRSLIASLILKYGEREAELIVRGWRKNTADGFYRDDVAVLQAVVSGECQIAIADTSVLATFTGAGRDVPLAAHRFPEGVAVLIDISGAAVARHAQNPEDAGRLLHWLRSETPNALFASSGNEFPVNATAQALSSIEAWSEFVADPMAVSQLSYLQEEAARLAERARYR